MSKESGDNTPIPKNKDGQQEENRPPLTDEELAEIANGLRRRLGQKNPPTDD